MNRFEKRNDRGGRVGNRIQVGHHPPSNSTVSFPQRSDRCDPAVVSVRYGKEGRDVDTLDSRQPGEQFILPATFPAAITYHGGDFEGGLFAVTEKESVEEISQRLRVHGARPAPDHQRPVVPPLRRQERNARKFKHIQDIGVRQFVLEGEPEDIRPCQWQTGLQGCQGCVFPAQHLLHVGPRGINAFSRQPFRRVENPVQDLQSEMTHSHFIDVGEGEHKPEFGVFLRHGAHFPSHIPGGFFAFQQIKLFHYISTDGMSSVSSCGSSIKKGPGGSGRHGQLIRYLP